MVSQRLTWALTKLEWCFNLSIKVLRATVISKYATTRYSVLRGFSVCWLRWPMHDAKVRVRQDDTPHHTEYCLEWVFSILQALRLTSYLK